MRPQPIITKAGQESVWDYPRPPRFEPANRHIRVVLAGKTIADSRNAIRVLETSHPPVYYIFRGDVDFTRLSPSSRQTHCEWKGAAVYFDVAVGSVTRQRAAWSYPEPTDDAISIRDHIAFYAALMDECSVDGQIVTPQPGGFYGGWITDDLVGPFKGGPGTEGW